MILWIQQNDYKRKIIFRQKNLNTIEVEHGNGF